MTTTIPTRSTADTAVPITRTDFHLAIVGGCMSHQSGIPFNSLYHRQLGQLVDEVSEIRLRPHVARAFGEEFLTRLEWLSTRSPIDAVLLHVRVVVSHRARLIAKDRSVADGKWRLHPALLNRRHSGAGVEALRASENAGAEQEARGAERAQLQDKRRGRRVGGLSVRELSSAMGALVRLDRWAVDDEMLRLTEFVDECRRRGLPVFILGPTPLVGQRWAARVVRMLNERIPGFAKEHGLPYALIGRERDRDGRAVVKRDGVHLTVEGHRYIAGSLVEAGFVEWAGRHSAEPRVDSINRRNQEGTEGRDQIG